MNDPEDRTVAAPAKTEEEQIAAMASLTEQERETLLAQAEARIANDLPPKSRHWTAQAYKARRARAKQAAASRRKNRR